MFKAGDQILFNPGHEEGKEYGFVIAEAIVSWRNESFFACRFWSQVNLGCLRNMANSEICKAEQLTKTGENVPQAIVNAWLEYLGYVKNNIEEK